MGPVEASVAIVVVAGVAEGVVGLGAWGRCVGFRTERARRRQSNSFRRSTCSRSLVLDRWLGFQSMSPRDVFRVIQDIHQFLEVGVVSAEFAIRLPELVQCQCRCMLLAFFSSD